MANSRAKIKCYHSAFASRRRARALAAYLPRQDHVDITTCRSFRFHNNKFDEITCKMDSKENPHPFKKYSTPPSFIFCTLVGEAKSTKRQMIDVAFITS